MTNNFRKQRKLQAFVDREVIMLASQLVVDLIKSSMYDNKIFGGIELDNIENLYITDDATAKEYGYDSLEAMQESGEDQQEIFEWWFVTEWFYQQLRKRNQPVLKSDYGYLWGRTCTGQVIYMDGVIEKIYDDLQRL